MSGQQHADAQLEGLALSKYTEVGARSRSLLWHFAPIQPQRPGLAAGVVYMGSDWSC